jgi:U3 small nucleolar RNA-associated protein 6
MSTNRIRALQSFPNSSELWILAAHYEYQTNFNISGARNLLLRSLRLNPEKQELWFKLAELECLYILKITERRRILGLDKKQLEDRQETQDKGDFEANEIALPSITEEELNKSEGPQFDTLLTSPLTDISTNAALNGAVPMAVYSSAIATRPDDISICRGFYDIFLSFSTGSSALSFIDSALDTVKARMEERFSGRGLTVLIRIKDHARGIAPTEVEFPAAIRKMMKTANATVPSLSVNERRQCCNGLFLYMAEISQTTRLDENLRKVVTIFQRKAENWRTMDAK